MSKEENLPIDDKPRDVEPAPAPIPARRAGGKTPRKRDESTVYGIDSLEAFSIKIREATGCSERQARYQASIARAFDMDQLDLIRNLDLKEEHVRNLASVQDETERNAALAAISSGDDPEIVIANAKKNVQGPQRTKVPLFDAQEEAAWLKQECSEIRA